MIYKRYFLMNLLLISWLNIGLTASAARRSSLVSLSGVEMDTGPYTINILNVSPAPGYFQASSSNASYIVNGSPVGPSLVVEGFLFHGSADVSTMIALIPMGSQAQLSYPGPLKRLAVTTETGEPVGAVNESGLPANGGFLYLLPAIMNQGVVGITDKTSGAYFRQAFYYTADNTQKMKVAYLDYLVKIFNSFNMTGPILGDAQNALSEALAGLAER